MNPQPLTEDQRAIVARILGYVEKNLTEVEQVEAYLYQLLDKGTEFESDWPSSLPGE